MKKGKCIDLGSLHFGDRGRELGLELSLDEKVQKIDQD